jgi:hypothetical protein
MGVGTTGGRRRPYHVLQRSARNRLHDVAIALLKRLTMKV